MEFHQTINYSSAVSNKDGDDLVSLELTLYDTWMQKDLEEIRENFNKYIDAILKRK